MDAAVAYVATLLRQVVVRKAAVLLLTLASGMLFTTGLLWAVRYLFNVLVDFFLDLWSACVEFVVFYWNTIVRLAKALVFLNVAFALGLYLSYDFFDSDPRASALVGTVTDGLSWLILRAVGALNVTAVRRE